MLDPAGSGAQGDSWRFEMHRGFGGKEVATTVEASRYLQENLDYIDADRCGKSILANELNFDKQTFFSGLPSGAGAMAASWPSPFWGGTTGMCSGM